MIVFPEFLIIGAARSGTTTLYQWLLDHPEIFVPRSKRPEPSFFTKADNYSRGLEHYARVFAARGDERVAGEASTIYLNHPAAPARIARHLPNAKLLVMLRHPVDRAWSNYWHTCRSGLEPLSFAEALAAEPERIAKPSRRLWDEVRPYSYVDRGRYRRQLERFLAHFPREQLWLGLFDDLTAEPARLARSVFGYLGVDPDFVPPSLEAALNASTPRSEAMPAHIRRALLETFAEEVEVMERWLDRDLSSWRR